MGGAASKPKGVSRKELLAMTQKPRDFVNQLFQVMISQLTPKELLDLGNRGKCKEYVFVMADAIYKTFDAIKVIPTKDKKTGVLFYKKVSEITTKDGAGQTYEHCLSLAYFYVRIFQIFGALALTVIDDPGAGQVLGYLQQATRPAQPSKNIPRIRGTAAVPFGASFRGGTLYEDDSAYKRLKAINLVFLAPFVSKSGEDSSKYKLGFDFNSNLQLLISKTSSDANLVYGPEDSKFVVTKVRAASRGAAAQGLLLGPSGNQYILSMSGFYLTDEKMKSEKTLSGEVRLVIERVGDDFYAKKADSSTDESKPVVEKIEEILKRKREDLDKKGTVAPTVNALGRTVTRPATELAGQYDVGVSDGLYNGFIIKYLEGKEKGNPVPFCVARAIQLIDMNALDLINPGVVKTHICETTFEPAHGMIPKAGESLTKSPGLFALSQLYYTDYHIEKKADGDFQFSLKPADGAPGEYVAFLTAMRDLFTRDTSKAPGAKLGDIKFAEPACDGTTKGKTLQITDPAAINNIKQTVGALFSLQVEHSKRVIDFMRKRLVEITSASIGGVAQSTIKIHPNLMKGGVAELNKLAYEARNILVDYYTKCEKTYQLGFAVAARSGKV